MDRIHDHRSTQRLKGRSVFLISLVSIALMALVAVPVAMAVTAPVEQILRITRLSPLSDERALIESRLIFPAGAHWAVDPDAGPLTLAVESGKIGIVLGGGLARIERQQSPLQAVQFQRLDPGRTATLMPGDKLIVVRGYQLRVDNDEDAVASAAISRIVRAPLPTVATGEQPGRPR